MHLVEGHRRLGALRGLVKGGWLEPDSTHRVWIGRVEDPPFPEGPWRDVVRAHPVPFAEWLTRFRSEEGEQGRIGQEFDEMSQGWELLGVPGTDDVIEHVQSHPELGEMVETFGQLHEAWIDYTNP